MNSGLHNLSCPTAKPIAAKYIAKSDENPNHFLTHKIQLR